MRLPASTLLRLLGSAVLLLQLHAGGSQAAEPPGAPMLRLESGVHGAPVRRAAVDRAERYVATVSWDKTIRVWELATGKPLSVLRPPAGYGFEGMLYSVAMSPDGETIAAGGWSGYDWDRSNSVYLFNRSTGRLERRLTGLPGSVNVLEWSPDGNFLAVGLPGRNGLRFFRTRDWALLGEDRAYEGDAYGLHFDGRGRLLTSSADGDLRLYAADASGLRLLLRKTAPGSRRPVGARFSPDGERVAVGYDDTPRVDVLSAATLDLQFSPDTSGTSTNQSNVAWSQDGSTLYAGGRNIRGSNILVRAWASAGRGAYRELHASSDSIMTLLPLRDSRLLFSSADPAWGVLDRNGSRVVFVGPAIADHRTLPTGLKVSSDGSAVGYFYEYPGRHPTTFRLGSGELQAGPHDSLLLNPRTTSAGLEVTGWQDGREPRLNGQPLKLEPGEVSMRIAVAPDGESFAQGTNWSLRRFDRNGTERWKKPLISLTWAVNITADGRLVVAALGDGTIRWYRHSDGAELLAFFPHSDRRRWVLWTPTGYYDASPGAEDLIGWHLNRGSAEAADFFPASRFRGQFYRPDVIARVLETADESRAVQLADAEAGRKQAARVEVALPPVVQILSPNDGSTVSSSSVTLRFSVRSPADAPATGLRARVNGQSVSIPDSRNLVVAAAGERQVTLTIPEADSEIMLFAENRNGVSTPASVRLQWRGRAPPREEFVAKPKLFVLAIGVSRYRVKEISLQFAAKDATDFSKAVMAQKGQLYRDVEVKLLTDEKATKDDILDGLDWIRSQVTSRDVGMVYFAGHGDNDPDGRYYFLPSNTDPKALRRTALPYNEIKETLQALPGKAVFFVDTCHSGNVLGTGRRNLPPDTTAMLNELASAENGVVVFTASTGRQYSLEDPKWGNGASTKALVEGLLGKADYNRNGRITHKMLDLYISDRVKELTGNKQTPVTIVPQGVPDFPLVLVGK